MTKEIERKLLLVDKAVADGQGVNTACKDAGMSHNTYVKYRGKNGKRIKHKKTTVFALPETKTTGQVALFVGSPEQMMAIARSMQ